MHEQFRKLPTSLMSLCILMGYTRWMPELPAPHMMVIPTIIPGGQPEQLVPPLQIAVDTPDLKLDYKIVSSEAEASDHIVYEPLDKNVKMQDPK